MPKFPQGYNAKTNLVDNDKIAIADSEAANEIKSVTKAALEKSLSGGTLANSIVYTASGSYAKPAKLKYIIVEVVGGGGGGGGIPATTAAGVAGLAAGGGGGGYARKKILASALAASEFVTRGAGGNAGAAGANAGGAGGASSFGSFVSAGGGIGGTAGQALGVGSISPVNGGDGSGGDVNISGGPSTSGRVINTSTPTISSFSNGGNSAMGQGGSGSINGSFDGTGKGYGGGGAAASFTQGQNASPGYAGTAGIVIVHEYF